MAGTWPQGAILALLLLGVLVLVGRWLPNAVAGFSIAAVPGSVVIAIIQFATGSPGAGWILLLVSLGLVVMRVIVAQMAGRRADQQHSFYS